MTSDARKPATYDFLSRLNHWVLAVLMIAMLGFGIYLEQAVPPGPERGALMGLHKSFGLLVLLLGSLRVVWRLRQGFPADAGQMPAWQSWMAKAVHWILMAGIIIMPVSGLVGSFFGGRATGFFGLFTLPAGPKVEWLSSLAHVAHGLGGMVLIVAVLLHVVGALKHHFVDKDITMLRMVGKA